MRQVYAAVDTSRRAAYGLLPISGHRLIRRAVGLLAVGLLLCGALASAASAAPDVRLRVMTLNIFYGGDELDLSTGDWCAKRRGCTGTLERVIQAIRASGADVVGLEEGEGSTRRIARELGWHASERTQVISRYRLIDPPGANGLYVFVELGPGRVVAISNSHLPSDPYGPYLVRDGGTAAELDDLERTVRLPAIQDQLAVLPGLVAQGVPVFVTGDFNSPSHLDWTPAVAAVRPEVPFPFDWPVSQAYADAGFLDSYREAHPDPVAVPGFTWTPGGLESVANEVHDRIDWVLVSGPATTLQSEVVGERNGPDVDIGLRPYPTDHRGVVSTFVVEPGEPEDFAAPEARRVRIGESLSVVFHGGAKVALVRGRDGVTVDELPTLAEDGTLTFSTAGFKRGAYRVVLLDGGGAEISHAAFWLYPRGEPARITTSRRVYERGERIRVRWWNAPGMRWDWVAVYRVKPGSRTRSATPVCRAGYCGNDGYLLYEYTHAAVAGSTVFSSGSPRGDGRWPLRPGLYEVRLLLDDGYSSRAKSKRFRIVPRA
jgi:endonuclease/exonuclease/phosphatase family metal-dependent hydrolase